jgi:hypothetical protein
MAFGAIHPAPASAWGFAAHQFIMGRAIDLLPSDLKPFFDRHRAEVVFRVKDPDLWRNVGWPDDANHFMDFGVREYGAYPFAALPRDYTAALQKFGEATLTRNGRLPWRLSEMFGNLRRAFEGFDRKSPYAVDDTVLFAAVASHYLQDAYQPLHATDNYDGQQSGQRGIHSRFESQLFERYVSRLTIAAPAVVPIRAPEEAAWTVLLASYTQVDPLLAADKQASNGRDMYDDVYFDRFFENVRTVMEQRLSAAISATAGLITGAWIEAGRPTVGTAREWPAQRVDRGR